MPSVVQIVRSIAARQRRLEAFAKGHGHAALAQPENYAWVVSKDRLGMARLGGAVVAEADDETKSIPFIISTFEEDRDGDVLHPEGCYLGNYAKNPVIFFGHQEWEIPIAKAKGPDGKLAVYPESNLIRSVAYFDTEDPDADYIYGKVKRGFLNASSISFVPMEAYPRQRNKAQGRNSDMPHGWDFVQFDLTEWSVVGVPANAGAIRDSLDQEKSFISPRLQKALAPFAANAKGRCFSGWCPSPTCSLPSKSMAKKTCCDNCKHNKPCCSKSIESDILSYLEKNPGAKPADLRRALGQTNFDNRKPLNNPVNAALVKLRDSGKVRVQGGGWGEPSFYVKSAKAKANSTYVVEISTYPDPSTKSKRYVVVVLEDGVHQVKGTQKSFATEAEANSYAQKMASTYNATIKKSVKTRKFANQAMMEAGGTNFPEETKDAPQDCVSHKIPILLKEGYKQDQAAAIAYSMCGEKKSLEDISGHEEIAKRLGFKALGETSGKAGGYTVLENKDKAVTKALSKQDAMKEANDVKRILESRGIRVNGPSVDAFASEVDISFPRPDPDPTIARKIVSAACQGKHTLHESTTYVRWGFTENKGKSMSKYRKELDEEKKNLIEDGEEKEPDEEEKDLDEEETEEKDLTDEAAEDEETEEKGMDEDPNEETEAEFPVEEQEEELPEEEMIDKDEISEDSVENLESAEDHAEEAEDAIATGNAPLGAQILAHLMDHIQSAIDYLQGSMGELEPEAQKALGDAMHGPLQEYHNSLSELAGSRYPDHDMASIVQNKMEEDNLPPENGEGDETTQEVLQPYQTLKSKSIKKNCNVMKMSDKLGVVKEAADFMHDLASDEGMRPVHKAGLSYHGYNLKAFHKDMTDGDDGEELEEQHQEDEAPAEEVVEKKKTTTKPTKKATPKQPEKKQAQQLPKQVVDRIDNLTKKLFQATGQRI